MKKKVLTKLGVRREIIRTLDETRRAIVDGGANCQGTNMASQCITAMVAPPRED